MLPVTDSFRLYAARALGIRPAHARSAVQVPQAQETLSMREGAPAVGLYLRHAPRATPARWMLVLTDHPGTRQEEITMAWPVPERLIDSEDLQPLGALRSLCEEFGMMMDVGGTERTRFVLRQSFSGTPADVSELIEISDEELERVMAESGAVLPAFHGLVEPDAEREETDITFAYVMDLAALRAEFERGA